MNCRRVVIRTGIEKRKKNLEVSLRYGVHWLSGGALFFKRSRNLSLFAYMGMLSEGVGSTAVIKLKENLASDL